MRDDRYKVLLVIYDMSTAGAQTVVMNYMREMKDDPTFAVSLLIRDSLKDTEYENELIKNGYNVVCADYKPIVRMKIIRPVVNWFRCQLAMFRAIKKCKPDIIHSHISTILPFLCIPVWLLGVKIRVHTLHSDPYAIPRPYLAWTKAAIKLFGFYPVCVTNDQAKKAAKIYNIDKYTVIRNGLDIQPYTNWKGNETIVKKMLSIPDGSFVIGYVGSLYSTKNVSFLIELFSQLLITRPESVLLIVGDGVDRKKLEQQCMELKIEDKVFFTGVQNNVIPLYHIMDVFVLPSKFESSSIVTVEAQLCGVRCVVSDAVPVDVIISNNVNRISLDSPLEIWMEAIMGRIPSEQPAQSEEAFSISNSIMELKKLYIQLLKRELKDLS